MGNSRVERFWVNVDLALPRILALFLIVNTVVVGFTVIEQRDARERYVAMAQIDAAQSQRILVLENWLTSFEGRIEASRNERARVAEDLALERGRINQLYDWEQKKVLSASEAEIKKSGQRK